MEQNEGQNKAKLFAKMAKVMGELTTFHKDAKNQFHGYGYASAAQVTEVVGRAMAKAGIAFFSSTIGMQTTEDKRYIVEYEFTFACSETGATFSSRWFGEAVHTTQKGAIDDKALNKAATTALKYFLLNTFVVSAADDVDVDANQNGRKATDSKPSNVKQGDFKRDDNNQASGFTVATNIVTIKMSTGKNPKPYYVIGGISTWEREPLRALGFTDAWLDSEPKAGVVELSDPVIIEWAKDNNGYKIPVSIKRVSTGEIVDKDGNTVTEQAS